MTVGERIRQVRETRGWTQDRLAEDAKVSRGFLSEVENKGKNISLDLLLRIATALGASVAYLATGEGSEPGERKPVVIPHELSEAAEQVKLSFQETIELLEAYNSVVARRSNRQKGTMSVQDWVTFWHAVKDVIRKVYG
jgi:transcriptional regulator with XRE-family HTH domain